MTLSKIRDISLSFISLHYSKCPVPIREFWVKIFQEPPSRKVFFSQLKVAFPENPPEMIWILTCNRCDVAFVGNVEFASFQEALIRFCKIQHISYCHINDFKNYGIYFHGVEALNQLMRIASSLDSLVLGESQILGQLKNSFALSLKEGYGGISSSKIFQACFHAAKRVRKETHLGYHGVSIGHASVQMVLKVYDKLDGLKILIVGSGQMARLAAQHALAKGAKDITIANRTFINGYNLAKRISGLANAVHLEEALDNLYKWQVILVASASPYPIILKDHFNKRSSWTQVVVDMSMPRNVDPAIGHLEDVFLFDVDSLESALFESKVHREEAAKRAQVILKDELNHFLKTLYNRERLINIGRFHQWVCHVVEQEVNKSLQKGNINSKIIARAVAKKISAGPIAALKNVNKEFECENEEALLRLFSLPNETQNMNKDKSQRSRDAS